MYSGWTSAWPIDRQLTQEEKDSALPRHRQEGIEPDDRGAATAFNSTYVEFVGRRFRLRGGVGTVVGSFLLLFLITVPIALYVSAPKTQTNLIVTLIVAIFDAGWLFFLWYMIFRKEYFTHTYYPIRFNRKTREVYVFRDARDGGIITVPWEDGFFHIGRGLRTTFLRDLRCHVIGHGQVVQDTFAVGHYFDRDQPIQELWEFVHRYMEEGPQALHIPFLQLSAAPTWTNCWILASASAGAASVMSRVILSPFLGLLAATRWLVMKTCKEPVWSNAIEAKCAIEPNDPFRLETPEYIGEGFNKNPEAFEAHMRKVQADRESRK